MKIKFAILLTTLISISACSDSKVEYSCEDMENLEKLASENNSDAQTTLVTCYQKAAEQGDARAQNNLGAMYKFGQGVNKDLSKAIELYQKAADQGYALAQNNLGMMYEFGQGVNKDLSKALELYQKAVDQGEARAQSNLGAMYEFGKGVNKDLSKAVEFYQKAADQGNAYAQNNLGFMYESGQGVDKDLSKAVEFYQKAADQGYELAIRTLKDKSLQFAIPFGLKIGSITLDQIKTKYKITEKNTNKWTNKPMYQIEPIRQIDFDGIQELTLVFDDKEVLQAVVAKFEKEKFDNLFEGLKRKYNSIYKQIPFVGDKQAVFETINGVIKIEAIHLSSYTTLYFNTNEFESLLQNGIQAEQLLKKQKEESML